MDKVITLQIKKGSDMKRKVLCTKCRKYVDNTCKNYIYYNRKFYHIGCFYLWLKSTIKDNDDKINELKDAYSELSKYMPEILAENIIINK